MISAKTVWQVECGDPRLPVDILASHLDTKKNRKKVITEDLDMR